MLHPCSNLAAHVPAVIVVFVNNQILPADGAEDYNLALRS
jgi:hypothetical protein